MAIKARKRAPKIYRRQLDALFADIPRERRRQFFDKAYSILERSADEILRSKDGVWGDMVQKYREDRGLTLMKMASEIAGIAERSDKREEPYRKILLGLAEADMVDDRQVVIRIGSTRKPDGAGD